MPTVFVVVIGGSSSLFTRGDEMGAELICLLDLTQFFYWGVQILYPPSPPRPGHWILKLFFLAKKFLLSA